MLRVFLESMELHGALHGASSLSTHPVLVRVVVCCHLSRLLCHIKYSLDFIFIGLGLGLGSLAIGKMKHLWPSRGLVAISSHSCDDSSSFRNFMDK